jgi:hypothetical protein
MSFFSSLAGYTAGGELHPALKIVFGRQHIFFAVQCQGLVVASSPEIHSVSP